MSKPKQEPKAEPSPMITAFTLIPNDGGFQIIEFQIQDSIIKSVEVKGPAEVLAITLGQMTSMVRKTLGL